MTHCGRGLSFSLLACFSSLLRSGQGGQPLAHDVQQSMSVVDAGAGKGAVGSNETPSDEVSCSPCRDQCLLSFLFWLLRAYDDPGRSSGGLTTETAIFVRSHLKHDCSYFQEAL